MKRRSKLLSAARASTQVAGDERSADANPTPGHVLHVPQQRQANVADATIRQMLIQSQVGEIIFGRYVNGSSLEAYYDQVDGRFAEALRLALHRNVNPENLQSLATAFYDLAATVERHSDQTRQRSSTGYRNRATATGLSSTPLTIIANAITQHGRARQSALSNFGHAGRGLAAARLQTAEMRRIQDVVLARRRDQAKELLGSDVATEDGMEAIVNHTGTGGQRTLAPVSILEQIVATGSGDTMLVSMGPAVPRERTLHSFRVPQTLSMNTGVVPFRSMVTGSVITEPGKTGYTLNLAVDPTALHTRHFDDREWYGHGIDAASASRYFSAAAQFVEVGPGFHVDNLVGADKKATFRAGVFLTLEMRTTKGGRDIAARFVIWDEFMAIDSAYGSIDGYLEAMQANGTTVPIGNSGRSYVSAITSYPILGAQTVDGLRLGGGGPLQVAGRDYRYVGLEMGEHGMVRSANNVTLEGEPLLQVTTEQAQALHNDVSRTPGWMRFSLTDEEIGSLNERTNGGAMGLAGRISINRLDLLGRGALNFDIMWKEKSARLAIPILRDLVAALTMPSELDVLGAAVPTSFMRVLNERGVIDQSRSGNLTLYGKRFEHFNGGVHPPFRRITDSLLLNILLTPFVPVTTKIVSLGNTLTPASTVTGGEIHAKQAVYEAAQIPISIGRILTVHGAKPVMVAYPAVISHYAMFESGLRSRYNQHESPDLNKKLSEFMKLKATDDTSHLLREHMSVTKDGVDPYEHVLVSFVPCSAVQGTAGVRVVFEDGSLELAGPGASCVVTYRTVAHDGWVPVSKLINIDITGPVLDLLAKAVRSPRIMKICRSRGLFVWSSQFSLLIYAADETMKSDQTSNEPHFGVLLQCGTRKSKHQLAPGPSSRGSYFDPLAKPLGGGPPPVIDRTLLSQLITSHRLDPFGTSPAASQVSQEIGLGYLKPSALNRLSATIEAALT